MQLDLGVTAVAAAHAGADLATGAVLQEQRAMDRFEQGALAELVGRGDHRDRGPELDRDLAVNAVVANDGAKQLHDRTAFDCASW